MVWFFLTSYQACSRPYYHDLPPHFCIIFLVFLHANGWTLSLSTITHIIINWWLGYYSIQPPIIYLFLDIFSPFSLIISASILSSLKVFCNLITTPLSGHYFLVFGQHSFLVFVSLINQAKTTLTLYK